MSRLLRKFAFCSKTDVSEQRSEVECAICQDTPTKPCTVPCGNHHVFCLACLQGVVTFSPSRNHFQCPLCRKRVRIPLGGVSALRQGKGRCLLTRLPVLLARCRRSSSDSVSSGWPDDVSVFNGVEAANSDSDDTDDLSSMGIPSEGGESMRDLDIDHWLDPSEIDVENQAAILEDIHRERERNLRQEPSSPLSLILEEVMVDRLRRMGSVDGESVNGSEGPEEGAAPGVTGHGNSALEEAGEIVLPTGAAVLSEDLDMTVVLELIADMEKNDHEEKHHATSPKDKDTAQCQDPESLKTSHHACFQAADNSFKMTDDSPRPGSTQQPDAAKNEDWKLKTIADTPIPRPKLTVTHEMSGERRSFRRHHEEDHLDGRGPDPPHQQLSADTTAVEDEPDFPQQLKYFDEVMLRRMRISQQRMLMSTDQDTSPESQSSGTEKPGESIPLHSQDLLTNEAEEKTETPSTEQQSQNSYLTISEDSERWNTHAYSCPQNESRNTPSESHHRRHHSEAGRDTPRHLPPEEWRSQELQKHQAAGARKFENPAEDELYPDAEGIISEGPNEWVRRIRSLHHRRRAPNAKRSITRSHSHGSRMAVTGQRDGEKEAARQRAETSKMAAAGGGEVADTEAKCEDSASNFSVIHL